MQTVARAAAPVEAWRSRTAVAVDTPVVAAAGFSRQPQPPKPSKLIRLLIKGCTRLRADSCSSRNSWSSRMVLTEGAGSWWSLLPARLPLVW